MIMLKKTLMALAAAATLAGATVATTSSAQAGGLYVGYGHHGYGHVYKPYKPWKHYGYGYGGSCYYVQKKVWTDWGPEWVSKKVCPWY